MADVDEFQGRKKMRSLKKTRIKMAAVRPGVHGEESIRSPRGLRCVDAGFVYPISQKTFLTRSQKAFLTCSQKTFLTRTFCTDDIPQSRQIHGAQM